MVQYTNILLIADITLINMHYIFIYYRHQNIVIVTMGSTNLNHKP